MTEPTKLDVRTDDGVATAYVHRPTGDGTFPGIVYYPDAGSIRPASQAMAARLAALGYVVLIPNIFYRAGEVAPFDFQTVFTHPEERARLFGLVRALDRASAMRDAAHYIRALHEQKGVAPGGVGTVGYCIGGKLAFSTAASHPDLVAAAASLHGGGISNDAPDSPHLDAAKIKARLYFGIADNDPSCTPEQQAALVTALAASHVRFTIDHFAGAQHGFAMEDFPVYHEASAKKHWQRLEELFGEALGQS